MSFYHSHYGASMQLDCVFSPSEIPVPVSNPIVDEHHADVGLASADNNAGIGLARAKVQINDKNDDVIGLARASTNSALPLTNFAL